MELLQEIICNETARARLEAAQNAAGQVKIFYREAVRGIILRGRELLMIYSPVNQDYKFPGGGVGAGESYEQTLYREVLEESGAQVARIDGEFGKVIEYDLPMEKDYDLFKMTSYYYLCQIEPGFGHQQLDDYEEDLKFCPRWVDIDEAIQNNQTLIDAKWQRLPRWALRDTILLNLVKERLLG
jgi:8-oxo-dGTP pyrophosphatase MutT (NUDIX family)